MRLTIIAIILMLFFTAPALGETINPLENFVIIEDIPGNISIGSQYRVAYNFTLTHDIDVLMNFSVLHTDVDYGEWDVYYILDDTVIVPDEVEPGQFSSEIEMTVGNHEMVTVFRSLPNIVPDEYGFHSYLVYDGIIIASVERKSSGGSSTWPTPTPTPTPTDIPTNVTPIPTQTAVVNGTNVTDTNISEPAESSSNKCIWIGLLLIIGLIIAIYYRERKNR